MNLISTPTPVPSATSTPIPVSQLFTTHDPLVQALITILWVLVVVVLAVIIARFVRRWIVRLFTRSHVNLTLAALIGNVVQVTLVVLAVVLVLPAFGVNWTGVLTLLGAAGLAVSLSLQDILKNIFAGVYILLEQPFRIGDRITVKEVTGTVQGIELRTTIMHTDEGLQVVVPNGTVLNEVITNRSVSDLRKQIIRMEIKNVSVSAVSQEVGRILKQIPDVASSPAPVTALEEIRDSTAGLRIEFWLPVEKRGALTAQVVEALQARYPGATFTVV